MKGYFLTLLIYACANQNIFCRGRVASVLSRTHVGLADDQVRGVRQYLRSQQLTSLFEHLPQYLRRA